MCINCFEEENYPVIINEKVIVASVLVSRIYDINAGGVGGYAHIVVDDWNIEDHSIDFCIKCCEEDPNNELFDQENNPELKEACLSFLYYFKTLSLEERNSSLGIESGYIQIDLESYLSKFIGDLPSNGSKI